jgi:Domain of unknown function (DUF4384)
VFRTPQSWLLFVALSLPAILPAARADEMKLRWAFGAVTGPADNRRFVRITDDITLRTGDEVQMFVSPVTACFVYVLHEDPAGEMTVLFPATPGAFPQGYGTGRAYYVPAEKAWLQLDSTTGIERIYLIASPQRLTQLEALLKQSRTAGDTRTRRNQVVGELARLTKQSPSAWSERPATIGGQIRGVPRAKAAYPEIGELAVEITAPGFFSRVFVIEHR